MKVRYLAFIFIGICFSVLILPELQRIFGYFPGSPGWEVARIAAEKKKVSLCEKIIDLPWGMFSLGPSVAESRTSCIHEYAKLTKDPSACELLMPSSYGLSCVGVAEDFELPCGTEKYTVYWSEKGLQHQASLAQCVRGGFRQSALSKQCCLVARVRYILNENDCAGVKENQLIYDRCLYGLAWKNRDPATCLNITNKNAKAGCLVQAKALLKDPSICSECTPSIDTVKQVR